MPMVCAVFVLICAVKTNICAGLEFEILMIIFLVVLRHSPPHIVQIAPNQCHSFVLCLCWFVPLKQTLYPFSFRRYSKFNSGAVTSFSTPFLLNRTQNVSFVCAWFVLICAVKINMVSISPPLEISNIIRGSDVTLHPTSSKSHQTGVVCLCSICAGLCH